MSEQNVSKKLLWPVLWLLGFRVRKVGDVAEVTIPRWIPEGQRRKMTYEITEKLKWQKFDTRIR